MFLKFLTGSFSALVLVCGVSVLVAENSAPPRIEITKKKYYKNHPQNDEHFLVHGKIHNQSTFPITSLFVADKPVLITEEISGTKIPYHVFRCGTGIKREHVEIKYMFPTEFRKVIHFSGNVRFNFKYQHTSFFHGLSGLLLNKNYSGNVISSIENLGET